MNLNESVNKDKEKYQEQEQEQEPIIHSIKKFIDEISKRIQDKNIVSKCTEITLKYFSQKNEFQRNPKWRGKNVQNHHLHPVRPRLNALNPATSREDIIRKEFLSILNKLSPLNYNRLINQIKNIDSNYSNIYIRIIWNLMCIQPQNQVMYINVCCVINNIIGIEKTKECFKDIYNEYIELRTWVKDDIDKNNYDEYCNYVKWKKIAMASLSGFCYLIINGFLDANINSIIKYILSGKLTHADRIDQLNALVTSINLLRIDNTGFIYIKEYCEYINKEEKLDSLTQFKLDELYKKLKI